MALPYVPRSIQSGQWSNIVFYSKKIDMPETFSHKIPLNHQLRRQYRYAKWQHCKFLFTPYHEAFLVNYLIFKMISFAGFCRIKNFFFEAEKRGFDPFFYNFWWEISKWNKLVFLYFLQCCFCCRSRIPHQTKNQCKILFKALSLLFSRLRTTMLSISTANDLCYIQWKIQCHTYPQKYYVISLGDTNGVA